IGKTVFAFNKYRLYPAPLLKKFNQTADLWANFLIKQYVPGIRLNPLLFDRWQAIINEGFDAFPLPFGLRCFICVKLPFDSTAGRAEKVKARTKNDWYMRIKSLVANILVSI